MPDLGRPVAPPIMPGWDDFDVPGFVNQHLRANVLVDNDVFALLRAGTDDPLLRQDAERLAEHLASRGLTVALTRSSRGATIREGDQRWDIPADPAREVDPTGAGDVFGIALTVSLARGATAPEAARAAAAIAARVVEGPELGNLTPAEARHLPPARSSFERPQVTVLAPDLSTQAIVGSSNFVFDETERQWQLRDVFETAVGERHTLRIGREGDGDGLRGCFGQSQLQGREISSGLVLRGFGGGDDAQVLHQKPCSRQTLPAALRVSV